MSKFSIILVALVIAAVAFAAIGLGVSYFETKTIQGTVLNAQGSPLPQAAITLAGRSALSDAQGKFQLQFPRGAWELRAFADGYKEIVQRIDASDFWNQDFSASLMLSPSEWSARIVSSDDDSPLTGALIELDGQQLQTDANGEFVAHGVRNGTPVRVTVPGYRTANLTVQTTASSNEIVTIPLSPSELTVTVVDSTTQAPLPGVRVQAGQTSNNTDINGIVVLRALTEGTEISAQVPGYRTVKANAGNETALTLSLEPTTLTGRIFDAETQQSVANAILLYGSHEGAATSATDTNGNFTIEDFSAVPKLYVKRPGYLLGAFDLNRGGTQDFALTPFHAKGIHLYYGIKKADAERVLEQFRGTEMNAVVFDVKEDPGYILWDSQTPLAKAIGAYVPREYTAQDQVQTCRDYNLYCIARVTVFKDVLLAQSRPDLALHNAAGGLLYENAAYWTNPAEIEVQDYHIGLAKELAAMGFDEIQYDYIRFPGTRDVLASEFGNAEYRTSTIQNFLERSSDALRHTTAFFSGDLFGLTTAVQDEQGIGQVWENVAPPFDYVSPMMYPSTWRYSTNLWGAFGITNCSDAYACAYEIMRYGTVRAQERTTNNWTLVRPWLQAYQMGLSEMLDQSRGSDDANSSGYLFWNNLAVYPDGLFKSTNR